ncbi:DUF3016 domain-containing protein [Colwellia sp. 6M3]|uniref:DUF3016 domain-containing protein n=1 Tax=Colwellia sp. 6M3 TaxID=2759849 RepID=UPI0021755E51|nr:DUF3016 domain-containing protein [Colwellia sp. 6M3]
MMKFITCLLSLTVVTFSITAVEAAQVEVKWTNPEKYTDVDSAQGHRQKFKERTFKNLEAHFSKLAEKLPEQQKLIFEVTNLDLAGDINYGIKRVRIIKDIFSPRMKFSYELLNADNTVVKRDDVSLHDMGFLTHSSLKYRNESLSYEKKMFDDWFKKTFENNMTK